MPISKAMPISARSSLKYRLVTTGDGSTSLHVDDLDERFHNPAGAYLEARQNYALPALAHMQALGRLDRDADAGAGAEKIDLLDACFGLGYNTYAFFFLLNQQKNKGELILRVTAIEIDDEPLSMVPAILAQPCFADLFASEDDTVGLALDIKRVDLRKAVQDDLVPESLDLIFHDAFSPRKTQHLWTKEIFDRYFAALRAGGALFTYATASAVKGGLIAAGFVLYKTAAVGSKPPALMAYKPSPDIKPDLGLLSIDTDRPRSLVPFRDPTLSADRHDIEAARVKEQALIAR